LKTFEYRGLDRAGRLCKGLVEALTAKDARERLAATGVLAESIAPTGRRLAFPVSLRTMVYRELSALLGAGVPMVRAFDHLIQSPELQACRSLLAGVKDRLREGLPLATALSEASSSFTPFEKAIVEAAERSAAVDQMLERLASFLEDQERTRERVQSAMVYPLIVLAVGICVAVLMLGLLVPRARDLLSAGNLELPWLTRCMTALGGAIVRWGIAVVAVLAGMLLLLRNRWRSDAELRLRWDRLRFRLPLWGRGYVLLANLRFARTLVILLRAGVPLIEGVILAGRATGSVWLAEMAAAEAETVRHGSSLNEALRRIPPLAGTLPGWIQIGEASGGLDKLLESAGRRYQDQWERFVGRCLAVLEPVLILLIGGFVLLVTLSVLLPVMSLTRVVR
jgi:general secretion pathway protein F